MRKGFLYIFFSHTDFPPKIQIFLVIYTDFVLDQSGRSASIFRFFKIYFYSPKILKLKAEIAAQQVNLVTKSHGNLVLEKDHQLLHLLRWDARDVHA